MEINAEFPDKLQFLFRPHRYKVARGGRGSAKSWSFARALLIQGIGKKLMTHFLQLARRHNADVVMLEVRPSNQAALGLYQQCGFNEIGVRRNYYPAENGREDALLLALSLV